MIFHQNVSENQKSITYKNPRLPSPSNYGKILVAMTWQWYGNHGVFRN